jgi:hypothetical protein
MQMVSNMPSAELLSIRVQQQALTPATAPQAANVMAIEGDMVTDSSTSVSRPPLGQWLTKLELKTTGMDPRRSLFPFAVACAPVIVTSVLAPAWLALIMALPCAWALYRVADVLQPSLFEASPGRGFAAYVMPLNALLMLWGAALLAAGHPTAIASTAFAWTALLCLTVAPACRWSRQRNVRRVPLRWSFPMAATLVIAAQSLALLEQLGWLGAMTGAAS